MILPTLAPLTLPCPVALHPQAGLSHMCSSNCVSKLLNLWPRQAEGSRQQTDGTRQQATRDMGHRETEKGRVREIRKQPFVPWRRAALRILWASLPNPLMGLIVDIAHYFPALSGPARSTQTSFLPPRAMPSLLSSSIRSYHANLRTAAFVWLWLPLLVLICECMYVSVRVCVHLCVCATEHPIKLN